MTPHAPVVLDIAGTALDADDRARLRHPLTGGLILFARNWQSRRQLTEVVGVDQQARTRRQPLAEVACAWIITALKLRTVFNKRDDLTNSLVMVRAEPLKVSAHPRRIRNVHFLKFECRLHEPTCRVRRCHVVYDLIVPSLDG